MAIMREPHGFWRPPGARHRRSSIADAYPQGKHRAIANQWGTTAWQTTRRRI